MLNDIKVQRAHGKAMPLYQQISQQLKDCILRGDIRKGERLPPLSELASHCQVDYKTANLALDLLEKEGLIRKETKRGRGALVSHSLAKKVSLQFIRWDDDPMLLEISEGIRQYVEKYDVEYRIVDARHSHMAYVETIEHPMDPVQGIIIFPQNRPEYSNAIRKALSQGIEVVCVDRVIDGVPASSVCIDNLGGAFQATKYLIEKHNRPAYYVGSANDPSSASDRFKGWSQAMLIHDYPLDRYLCKYAVPDHELASDPPTSAQKTYEMGLALFRERKEQTYSIFCVNDIVAKSIYRAAEDSGLKIGSDVFLFGFGDYPLCKQLPVQISSVAQHNVDVGYHAAKLLVERLNGKNRLPIHYVLPVELIIRESSG